MNIKLGNISTTLDNLKNVADKKLPIKLAYAIAKNRKALTDEFNIFMEQTRDVYMKHCAKDEEGKPIPSDDNRFTYETEEQEIAALTEIEELCNTETEINITTIDFAEIEKIDSNNNYDTLTVSDLEALDFMITD